MADRVKSTNVRTTVNVEQQPNPEPPNPCKREPAPPVPAGKRFYWGEATGSQLARNINKPYKQIAYWRRNFFTLPNGGVSKNFIREPTRLVNNWVEGSPLKKSNCKHF